MQEIRRCPWDSGNPKVSVGSRGTIRSRASRLQWESREFRGFRGSPGSPVHSGDPGHPGCRGIRIICSRTSYIFVHRDKPQVPRNRIRLPTFCSLIMFQAGRHHLQVQISFGAHQTDPCLKSWRRPSKHRIICSHHVHAITCGRYARWTVGDHREIGKIPPRRLLYRREMFPPMEINEFLVFPAIFTS